MSYCFAKRITNPLGLHWREVEGEAVPSSLGIHHGVECYGTEVWYITPVARCHRLSSSKCWHHPWKSLASFRYWWFIWHLSTDFRTSNHCHLGAGWHWTTPEQRACYFRKGEYICKCCLALPIASGARPWAGLVVIPDPVAPLEAWCVKEDPEPEKPRFVLPWNTEREEWKDMFSL